MDSTSKLLFEANPHSMWVYDLDSLAFLAVNEAAIQCYGYSRADFLGMTIKDIRPVEDLPRLEANLAGEPHQFEQSGVWRHRKKDGAIIEVEITSHALEFGGRKARLVLANNVSGLRNAEAALRERERMYATLLQNLAGMVYRCRNDSDWTTTFVSEGCLALTGYTCADLIDNRTVALGALIHPDDAGAVWEKCQENLANRRSCSTEYRIRTSTGEEKWVWDQAQGIYSDTGELLFIEGYLSDITGRKAAEAQNQRSLRTLQLFIDSVPGYVSFVDRDEYYRLVNPAYEDWFGRPRDQIVGRTLRELHPPEVYAELRPFVERALAGEAIRYEREIPSSGGSRHWFDCRYTPRLSSDGSVSGFFVLVFDVTPQKHAELALRESRARLDSILNSLDDVVWSASPDGTQILFVNPAIEKIYGRSVPEFLANPHLWFEAVHPEDQAAVHEAFQILLSGESVSCEYRIVRPDGTVRWIRDRAHPIKDGEDCVVRLDGITTDITALRQAEEERLNLERKIQQTQKLESLGVLAGGIAHDFNNLLTAVMGNISLAMLDLSPVAPAREELLEAEKATERAADLARQMLAYSGKGRFMIQRVDLREVVEEMTQMLQVSISKKAVLRFDFGADLPAIEADVTQLRQIILNLVINASDAIGEDCGVIAISTGAIECQCEDLVSTWSHESPPAGLYVYLEVADTGCGIPKEQLSKIFDPFFTTKFTGRGLGLAAVHGIVRGHQGALKIDSEVGRGTTFRVLLPAVGQAAAEGLARNGREVGEWSGQGLLLLVDDEEKVRNIGRRMLERFGFQVLLAADGREALETFRTNADRIDLVLLDLTMPHMDGEEAFRELRLLRPDLRVVLSSGYSEHDVVQRFAGQGLAGFIAKPYTMANLRAVLQRVLPGTMPGT